MPIQDSKLDDNYFFHNFNTPLNRQQQARFEKWAADQNEARAKQTPPRGPVVLDQFDYDVPGYWLHAVDGNRPDAQGDSTTGHKPDTFKKPNHPTFSDESIYHGEQGPHGPWEGGHWVPGNSTGAKAIFIPSEQQVEHHGRGPIQDYFNKREPNARVVFPDELKDPTLGVKDIHSNQPYESSIKYVGPTRFDEPAKGNVQLLLPHPNLIEDWGGGEQ